ncbi:nucleotidyltransferase family protein [uncultured Massilia sp.]|uniref:nucleotidyltransferase family protein n=1 Tax=uncultured Massilia sp. TaxID=169973 RepID=UPI0025D320EE|nr:nucleotidyltransferase family protein [uncultured Massilia sp.]
MTAAASPASFPVGILMAAGRGRRFDPAGVRNKLLQPLAGAGIHDEPVVAASARKLLAALPRVVAVVPPDDGGVAALLAGLGCIVTTCPQADSGMAASLVHALRHALQVLPGAPSWLVALGDMPHVAPATLDALVAALAAGAPIAAPVMDGRRGNPVGFGRVHLDALLALRGDQGARALLRAAAVTEIPVDDAGIFRDVDTPADL